MPRKTELPVSKHHIMLYDEDWQFLESRFGFNGLKPVGISNVIRAIIHQRVQALRAAEVQQRDMVRRTDLVPEPSDEEINSI